MEKLVTASIDTANEKRDEHLKSIWTIWLQTISKITFKSTKLKKRWINNQKCYKKVVSLDLETSYYKDPWGKQRTGFSLNGKIKRSDFGITWNKTFETGGGSSIWWS